MDEIKKDALPASGDADQGNDPNPTPTPGDSAEVKADKAKIQELEKQILQAGHVIETLKKDKVPSNEPPVIDEELLDQKIKDGVEKALSERLPDTRAVAAEEKMKTLLAERDELVFALRSKGNRSSDSGDGGQRHEVKPNLTLTAQEERFTKPPYNLTPEEIIKNR